MHLTPRAALGVAALCASCVSAPRQADRLVITSDPQVVRGCAFLGAMKTTHSSGVLFMGKGTEDVERKLISEVAAKSGNVVLIPPPDWNIWGSARSVGDAYRCSEGALVGTWTVAIPTERAAIAPER